MPFGIKPVCISCRVTTSTIWRKGANQEILCNSCGLKQASNGGKDSATNGNSTNTKNENGSGNGNQGNNSQGGPVLRKSARIKPGKSKVQAATKALATKGKSRRIIFKKSQPIKAPRSVATVVTGSSIFYDGQYYQVGDIVSLVDHEGGVFYAQLRGFMCDQYGEKSAVITWLVPTQNSPQDRFDASTYVLGPEEDIPRKMEYMDFVCHAPSEYFKALRTPYPVIGSQPDLCFIWTSLGPEIRTTPSRDEIFGVKDEGEDAASTASDAPSSSGRGGRDKDREKKDDRKVVKMECD
ncbi:GATA zinc finger domain-containing protein 1-like [Babylonia areolata]|uniref:GATA zinc finger domain-containing protein 1-like n=1 Tax=Babylonia areolata TaxID=304850 RepID=UPI003FD11A25